MLYRTHDNNKGTRRRLFVNVKWNSTFGWYAFHPADTPMKPKRDRTEFPISSYLRMKSNLEKRCGDGMRPTFQPCQCLRASTCVWTVREPQLLSSPHFAKYSTSPSRIIEIRLSEKSMFVLILCAGIPLRVTWFFFFLNCYYWKLRYLHQRLKWCGSRRYNFINWIWNF